MLKKLFIQNYAIIEEMEISFSPHLNIITGETGAGKSILLGALSLTLGERADSGALLNREKKCVVEALFLPENRNDVNRFLAGNDLDPATELLVRREIASSGKSRAFINDTPVNLEQLRELTGMLVDLHRQFDTLELGQSAFQQEVLDALAGNAGLLEAFRQCYREWQNSRQEWQEMLRQKQQADKELDYHRFLFSELEEAGLKENELEDIEQEIKMLTHAGDIKTTLSGAFQALEEGDAPLLPQLRTIVQQLASTAEFHAALPALAERLQSTYIEMQDIAAELEQINNHIHTDAARLEQVNERMAQGYKLLKKHGVRTTAELLAIQNGLSDKLLAVFNLDEQIAQKEKQSTELEAGCRSRAEQLSKKRKKEALPLEEKVNALLHRVGMPNAHIKVQVQDAELNPNGCNTIEFLFDANKSGQFQSLRRVASGGELSRIMLCIKSLVAGVIDLPTLIFDEIDTGISGEAARQAGMIMKDLSRSRQVICITHQPQIAGRADAHFLVHKEIRNDAIKTGIRLLSMEERITAIAQMLSGEKPTAAALENAREMVMN